jgi:hypothetical protein
LIEEDIPMWVEEEDEEEKILQTSIYSLLTIETTLAKTNSNEDTFISDFIQNIYLVTIKFDGFDN